MEQALGILEGCLEDAGAGVCLLLTYTETVRIVKAWKAELVLPETGGVRELSLSRYRQDFLTLRACDSEVPLNPEYPREVSHGETEALVHV